MSPGVVRPLLNAAKGSLIGAANIIPGVSGGTIAVVVRLYDELITAVSTFVKSGWRRNVVFLFPVIVGIAAGMLVFAGLVDYLISAHPIPTAFFFMGLVVGSGPFLVKTALRDRFTALAVIPFVVCLVVVVVTTVVGEPPHPEPITELSFAGGVEVFFAGAIGAAAMVVPGVSGSFVLLLLGMYTTFVRAVRDLNIPILAVLVPGCAAGAILVSKAMNWLLRRFHSGTYWAVTGLVLGSVPGIWPRTDAGAWILPEGAGGIAAAVAAFGAGFLAAWFLGSGRRPPTPAR